MSEEPQTQEYSYIGSQYYDDHEAISPNYIENRIDKLKFSISLKNDQLNDEHYLDDSECLSPNEYTVKPKPCDYIMEGCKHDDSDGILSDRITNTKSILNGIVESNKRCLNLCTKIVEPELTQIDDYTIDMKARKLYLYALSDPPHDMPFYFSLQAELLLSQRQFYKALVAATLVNSLISRFYHIQCMQLRSRMIAVRTICLYQLNDTERFKAMER